MKQYLTLTLLSFITLASFASNTPALPLKQESTFTEIDSSFTIKKDTLVLAINSNNEGLKGFHWQKNMPWIGAIFVGILTVLANIQISRQYKKTSSEITERQINNSKEIALIQIENVKKSVQLDFNKTVLSGNRQLWINELRELISNILSKTMSISVKQNISQEEFEHLRFLLTKAELMLNGSTDTEFIKALSELENCCLDILMGNKETQELGKYAQNVKKNTQITLKNEWERVKKGE